MSINIWWEKLDLEKKLTLLKKMFPDVTSDDYKEREKIFLKDKTVLKVFEEMEMARVKDLVIYGGLMLENIQERFGDRDSQGHKPSWEYHTQSSRARGRCR